MILGSPTSPDECDHCGHTHCKGCGIWGQREKAEFWLNQTVKGGELKGKTAVRQ